MTTLLIVEDEPDIRFLIRKLVEGGAHRFEVVAEAASEAEALECWRRLRPDAVVVDERLAPGSGLEVATTILAEQPDAVIVLCTSFPDRQLEREAADAGVSACLAKSRLRELSSILRLFFGEETTTSDP